MDRLVDLRATHPNRSSGQQQPVPEPEQVQEPGLNDVSQSHEPLITQLSPEEARLNCMCPETNLTELFELLDMDGNGTLELEELKVVHGSSSTLDAFFKDW